LADDCVVLKQLGKVVPFEIAVGMNGRVWVNAANSKHIILITNAILNSEHLQPKQIQAMIAKLSSHFFSDE
jgi:exosome complex component RRP40